MQAASSMQSTTQSQSLNLPSASPAFLSASLYVGDLNKDVREEHLFEIFSVVGFVLSIRVVRDHVSRVSLGYAYVNFASVQDAEKALNQLNHWPIEGRPLRIMWKQCDPSLRKSGAGNIFIKNIDACITSRDLSDTFSQFGSILSCKVATTVDGKSKGFGFIQYHTREEAEKAVKCTNGQKLTDTQSLALVVSHHVPADKSCFTNVLVKNIRDHVTDEQLAAAFASCGQITSAVVHRDANGKSKRHGFCNFGAPESAVKCIEQFNDSESLAEPGDKITVVKHLKRSDYMRQYRMSAKVAADAPLQSTTNLYVKYLDHDIDDHKLREIFAGCGQVTSAKVEIDKEKGVSKGFGYVSFSTPEEAAKAVTQMNGKILGIQPLHVSLFMPVGARLQFHQQLRMNPALYVHSSRMFHTAPPYCFYPGTTPALPRSQRFHHNHLMSVWPLRPVGCTMPGHDSAGAVSTRPQAVFKQHVCNVPSAHVSAPVATPPAPNKKDLAAVLAQATPEQQKQMLGEHLYVLTVPNQPQLAGKIVGMLLEGLDTAELLGLIDSSHALDEKIKLAVHALQQHFKG